MDRHSASPCETLTEQYRTLLEVAEAISAHRDLHELFRDLAQRLPRVVHVNFVALSLHDPERNVMRLHTIQANVPADLMGGHEGPVEESPAGSVWQTQQPILVPDLAEERRWPKVTECMKEDGTNSFCFVPLTTAVRQLGAMGFLSLQKGAYGETDVQFLQQVGKQVAVAVDNALNYQSVQGYQQDLARERDRLRLLLEVNNAVVSRLDLRDVFAATTASLHRVMPHEIASLYLYDPDNEVFRRHALDSPRGKGLLKEGLVGPIDSTPAGPAFRTGKAALFDENDLKRLNSEIGRLLLAEGVKSGCCVPLLSHNRVLGTLNIGSFRESVFTQDEVDLLSQVGSQVAIAVENALAYQQITELKDKLAKEKLYLEDEIRIEYNFEEIIGDSPALKRVLKQVEIVAPTDSTVLILGETGTGKELIARAIHNLSGRQERTFVKLNCAAIPSGLLESELFGHERGAFTGAIAQKVGRFELADKATLFLDEIGDIPLELQSKLLRVLQEQEFERLGSTRTIKINARLVAATNRNLAEMVAGKEFRNDLYYRLNVFPLTVPALRDRREDIPLLVRYFAQKFARRMNKKIDSISTESMTTLSRYHWPGNIRELENLIERAVILSQGAELYVPLAELKAVTSAETQPITSLEAAERDHIMRALQAAKWIIGGPAGAAAKLGMKRTTLQSKMQKLSISRPS
ncbi:MAG: sigma 54-interacting transcriptional regulator [Nitrospiraceae bacterium]